VRKGVITLVVLGSLLVPFASFGLWVQLVILRTSEFTALADDLLEQEEVRAALADEIADQAEAVEPQLAQGGGLLRSGIEASMRTAAFERIFRTAVSDLHAQLVDGGDELTLDLDPSLQIVREEVNNFSPGLGDQIPADEIGTIVLVTRDQAPYIWWGVEAMRIGSIVAVIGVIGCFAFAIGIADRRWLALGVSGIGIVVATLVVLGTSALAQSASANLIDAGVNRDAFNAIWDVLERSLQVQVLLLGLIGVAMAAAGFLVELGTARSEPEPARRSI
jgi:hypothetical protein